jgi:hypothetical protein
MIYSIVQYAILAAGLIGSLALFVSMKREFHRNAAMHRKEMDELTRKLNQAPAAVEPVFIAPEPRSGLNVSKRVQAMRLLRRNEDVSHVAAAMGVTRREVELLIRVQKLSATAVSSTVN